MNRFTELMVHCKFDGTLYKDSPYLAEKIEVLESVFKTFDFGTYYTNADRLLYNINIGEICIGQEAYGHLKNHDISQQNIIEYINIILELNLLVFFV